MIHNFIPSEWMFKTFVLWNSINVCFKIPILDQTVRNTLHEYVGVFLESLQPQLSSHYLQ